MHHHAAFGHSDLLAVEFEFSIMARCQWCPPIRRKPGDHAGLVLDVVRELVAEVLEHARTGMAAASPSAQMVRPLMLSAT
jgi:hypothetical protein